ncbi:RNA polymerase sigma factor [Frankia tisae]|uniref:RNA polymerase sigma factor n=1 Tax=Frankia tisae TaxID=2950104 RepID=UPI0021C180DD|nr:RNA polymerase sigma factor [Frankia tisae]
MRSHPDAEDAALVRAMAAGDEAALRVLFTRHLPWLRSRLARRCSDPEIVADVLQDTFVAAWKGARRWRGDGEVAAWLWGIAVRRLVSRLRGRSAPVTLPTAEVEAADERTLSSAEELVLLGVEHGDLAAALRRLSPQLRAVIEATVLDGLTTREAAQLLGLAQGTVKGRVRKAKAQLRQDLISYQSGWS